MSRGFRSSLALIAAIALAGYLYLKGRADARVDAGEAAQLRMVAHALAGHDATVRREAATQRTIDSAHAREARALLQARGERVIRRAVERRADSLLARGDTAAAVPALLTALATAEREIGNLELANAACGDAGAAALQGWIACRARRDSLEALLTSTAQLLERRRTFRLLFFRLPRPPKAIAAVVGCGSGAYLDKKDPLRGCGLGAGVVQLAVPTR